MTATAVGAGRIGTAGGGSASLCGLQNTGSGVAFATRGRAFGMLGPLGELRRLDAIVHHLAHSLARTAALAISCVAARAVVTPLFWRDNSLLGSG